MKRWILFFACAVFIVSGYSVPVRAGSADWIFEDEIDELENAGALSEESARDLRESVDDPSFAVSSRTLEGEWRTEITKDVKTRLTLADQERGFRFSGSFLKKEKERNVSWQKGYAGREFEWGQFYAGDFRCGFLEDNSRGFEERIKPDDRFSASRMRGAAFEAGGNALQVAGFCSSAAVAGIVPSFSIGSVAHAGFFAVRSEDGGSGIAGGQSDVTVENVRLRTVFARSKNGGFFFGRVRGRIQGGAEAWAGVKVRGAGFSSPVGDLFSGREPWKVLYGFSMEADERTQVSFQSSQFEKDGKVSGKFYAQAKRRISREAEVQLGQSFFDRENTEDPDSANADRWQSTAALRHRPFRNFESRFRVTASGKSGAGGQTKISEQVKMQAVFHVSERQSVSGEVRYSGDSSSSSGMDREAVRCEWRAFFGKFLDLKLRCERRSKAVTSELSSGMSEVLVRRDTWETLASLSATVRW